MINSKLILGADIRENQMSLSCCLENQTEIINENFILEKYRDADEIAGKMKEFLNKNQAGRKAAFLIYSCENDSRSQCKKMEQCFKQAGIGEEGIRLISKENAFVHYVMHQNEELYRYTVIAFEFNGTELAGYRLYSPNRKISKERKTEKQVIGNFQLNGNLSDMGNILDSKFADVAKQILSREVVSSVFLTGQGFEGGWMQKSLKVLCDGRRAFSGQNLFSAGCCYYGAGICKEEKTEYLIQAPETVLYESGVIDSGANDSFIKITEAGNAWYESKGNIDVILERGNRVDVVFVHSHTLEKQVESVDISGLSARPKKMGRLRISVEFFDRDSGIILVKDKGFGAFSPSTNQLFIKDFKLL